MERVCESKSLPRKLPTLSEVVGDSHLDFVIDAGDQANGHKVQNSNRYVSAQTWKGKNYVLESDELITDVALLKSSVDSIERVPILSEVVGSSHLDFVIDAESQANGHKVKNLNKYVSVRTWKGNNNVHESDELMTDVASLKSSVDSIERVPTLSEVVGSSHLDFVIEADNLDNGHKVQNSNKYVSVQTWKGKNNVHESDELMTDVVSLKSTVDSTEDVGSTSFHGVSHPPEPVDTDLMTQVYVPIGESKADVNSLVKSFSVKGPFIEDLSIRVPGTKPSISLLSPSQRLVEEEPIRLGSVSSPFTGPRPSQNTEASLPPDNEEKECVWDASLPPSGNVSPLSSIDSIGVTTAMSIGNSYTSTYRSDGRISDGMFSLDKNYESTKASCQGDSLESAKTSLASDSSGVSDDSNWSNMTGGNKPHKGNDPRWKAIHAIRVRDGILGMSHFRLLRRLGCGDIGSVYLSELSGTRSYFAMKVMDKASLASRKKLTRAQTEQEILQILDHPFLPTLYTHFETDRFSCLVMEYCPGGDLHTLRQRQPGKHFSEYAARFYAAEALLALEYLHMLGVVYRDLKPENILVRDDGHIMLSDFDLSLRCSVSPTLMKSSSLDYDPKRGPAFCVQPACSVESTSVCIQPACFMPKLFSQKSKKLSFLKTRGGELSFRANTLPELVAEPTAARSMSFVGTHEYLAPEIIKGEGHGSAVDWWTFGIFLHELLYGKTPFKGSGNRATLFNVVGQQLRFPESSATSYASRDLIRGLLVKEPQHRLGTKRGAAEIKQHPFFEGVNWALIRCSTPPEVPKPPVEAENPPGKLGPVGVAAVAATTSSKRIVGENDTLKSGGKYLDFEFF